MGSSQCSFGGPSGEDVLEEMGTVLGLGWAEEAPEACTVGKENLELKVCQQRAGHQSNRAEGRGETWGPLGNWLWWQLRVYKSLGMG